MKNEHAVRKSAAEFKKAVTAILLILPGILVVLPVVLLITGSVMDQYELKEYLNPIFMEGMAAEKLTFIRWKLMPDYPAFAHYGRLLFMSPQFFVLEFCQNSGLYPGRTASGGSACGMGLCRV